MADDNKSRLLHRVNLNIAGGVENQFRAFVEHPVVRERFQNQALIGEPAHPDVSDAVHRYTEEVYSFKRWHGIKLPRHPAFLRRRYVHSIIRAGRPDALLSWGGFANASLADGCERYDIPLIYWEGGSAWGHADAAKVRHFLDRTAGAVFNTHAAKRMLELKWGFNGPSRICLGGIRNDVLSPASQGREPREPVVLGCAGRLVAIKGIALAIQTLQRLGSAGVQAELRIAGDGPDRVHLTQLAETLGVADRVHFLGPVNDMQAFYEGVDVFLHAGLHETLGNVCIEAAANGCVVVAARVDGLVEAVEHDVTGVTLPTELDLSAYAALGGNPRNMPDLVYDPDEDRLRELRCVDPEIIAEAVASLVADSARFRQMSADAIERSRKRFSFDRYIDELTQAISDFTSADVRAQ